MGRIPKYIEILDRKLTLSEWVCVAQDDFGIMDMTTGVLKARLNRGWDPLVAITTPLRPYGEESRQPNCSNCNMKCCPKWHK